MSCISSICMMSMRVMRRTIARNALLFPACSKAHLHAVLPADQAAKPQRFTLDTIDMNEAIS